ncbi:hypothetical protein LXL04_017936 [Taraxacum kok-saghyz]
MDWNLNTSSEWDLDNIAMYSSKEIGVPKNIQFSSHETQENAQFSKDTIKTFTGFGDLPKDFLEKDEQSSWIGENVSCCLSTIVEEASVLSGEAMIGLKLGRHASSSSTTSRSDHDHDHSKTATTSSSVSLFPTSSPMIKRSRASYLSSQSPRCQVEGCNLDLSSSKDYHRRHKICANHSKSPKVVVAGMERRFCQQCSRKVTFHDLSEFDDRKRSCRRRLSAHNARRRRPQSEEIQFSSSRLSSSMCDRRPRMNFVLNRASIPCRDSAPPESSCNSLLGFAKGGGIDGLPINGALQFGSERFMPRSMNHNGMDATPNSILSGDVRHAFSLLSTTSWPSNWPEEQPSSFDQFGQINSISLSQPGMPPDLQNTTNPTHLQNFHSYKSPRELERFYSN